MYIDGTTKIIGVIGDPIEHSFSPIINNAAFEHLNLNYVYLPFRVLPDNLAGAIGGANKLNIAGLNVTIPHKQNVLVTLDHLDPIAKEIGAVNTIKFQDNEAIGYNTDGKGCLRALEEKTSLYNRDIVVVGAGGASRAICYQLAHSEINSLTIINRDINKAQTLASDIMNSGILPEMRFDTLTNLSLQLQDTDILINTTPLGMKGYPDQNPIALADSIPENIIVNDIVYNPIETNLIKEAKKAGAETISGIRMLIYQAAEAIKIWTDKEAPINIMENKLKSILTETEQ
jgi:shikimate dehydrogenase